MSCLSLITELIREWLDSSWHGAADFPAFSAIQPRCTRLIVIQNAKHDEYYAKCPLTVRVPPLSCLSHWFTVNKSEGLSISCWLSDSGDLIWGCLVHLKFMGEINKRRFKCLVLIAIGSVPIYLLFFSTSVVFHHLRFQACVSVLPPQGGKETPLSLFQVFQLFIVFLVLTFQRFSLEFFKTLVIGCLYNKKLVKIFLYHHLLCDPKPYAFCLMCF